MPTPNRRRFSLLSALLLLTTAAAAIGLYAARRDNQELQAEIAPLRTENAKLRAEQGVLTIEDPTKIHAIRLPDATGNVWHYRVWLPKGNQYYVAGQANRLPMGDDKPAYGPGPPPNLGTTKSGQSDRGGLLTASGCSPGEFLATVSLFRNDQGMKTFRTNLVPTTPGARGAMIGMGIDSQPGEWPAVELREPKRGQQPIGFFRTGVPDKKQSSLAVGEGPLVLFEQRFMHGSVNNSADSDEGLIVWIGVVRDETPE